MVKVGQYNDLEISRQVDFGMYLIDDNQTEILLPNKYVPENVYVGDVINVFVYRDSQDRIIATTLKPFAVTGEFCLLKVDDISNVGAFLNWGLEKDLLVPFREQKEKMQIGRSYLVYIYLDEETDRIVASNKLDRFLDNIPPEYETNQEVDILISHKTDIGYKVIINNLHWGVIYNNEVFRTLKTGDKMKAYIKKVREDEKIDVVIQKPGYDKIEDIAKNILLILEQNDGFLPVTDKSSPEVIKNQFKESKKNFKKAIGYLYRERKVVLLKEGIRIP